VAQFCIRWPQAVLSLVLLAAFFTSVVVASAGEYRIAPGDLISITVFGEEDLSLKQVRVATNGVVSFPLLGEVEVENYTARELEIRLTNLLRDGYLKKPKVTVSVLESRPFYMQGEVKRPGSYKYQEGLTVEKAIALAGGFGARASKRKITLSRDGDAGTERFRVKLNTPIEPGDVITVGQSLF